jgi:magnesium-transporting ATPase (P-type)
VEQLRSRKLMLKVTNNNASYYKLFRVAVLCNAAHIELDPEHEAFSINGYPTETGILRASVAILGGLGHAMRMKANYPTVHEIPFNSDNK